LELISRKKIQELEGGEGQNHIAEYADSTADCSDMGFDSLGYQSLGGLLEAIGLERDKVCTCCWTGEE